MPPFLKIAPPHLPAQLELVALHLAGNGFADILVLHRSFTPHLHTSTTFTLKENQVRTQIPKINTVNWGLFFPHSPGPLLTLFSRPTENPASFQSSSTSLSQLFLPLINSLVFPFVIKII